MFCACDLWAAAVISCIDWLLAELNSSSLPSTGLVFTEVIDILIQSQ